MLRRDKSRTTTDGPIDRWLCSKKKKEEGGLRATPQALVSNDEDDDTIVRRMMMMKWRPTNLRVLKDYPCAQYSRSCDSPGERREAWRGDEVKKIYEVSRRKGSYLLAIFISRKYYFFETYESSGSGCGDLIDFTAPSSRGVLRLPNPPGLLLNYVLVHDLDQSRIAF